MVGDSSSIPARLWGWRAFSNPRFVAAASILVASLCGLAFLRYVLSPLPLLDLNTHLNGALAWAGGRDPYRTYLLRAPSEIGGGYVFPPFTLPLFYLLARLPGPVTDIAWNIGAIGALAWLLWDLAEPRTPARLAWVTVLATLFTPVLVNFGLGQVGVFTLAAAWLAGRLATRGQGSRPGLSLAIASLFKLFPFVVGTSFALRRRLKPLLWGLLAIGLLLAASWPLVGSLWPEFITGVAIGHLHSISPSPGNQSMAAALTRTLTINAYEAPLLVAPGLSSILGMAAEAALLLGVVLAIRRQPDDRIQDALLLGCMPLLVPNAWQHYYVLALPLLWIVLSVGVRRRDPWLLAASLLSFVALSLIAATIDNDYFLVAHLAPALHGLYANASVLGGLILVVVAAIRLPAEPSGQLRLAA